MTNYSTMRPGLLVALSTEIKGNTSYFAREIEPEHVLENGETTRAVWETTRTVEDKAEQEAAVKIRGKCRSLVTGACVNSAKWLLCPDNRIPDFEARVAEARKIADDFNRGARITRVMFSVVTGRVAADDVAAVREINREVRELLADMESGLRRLDIEAIREAAGKATEVGKMLTPEAQERIAGAIEQARKAAREIKKAGTVAGLEVDRLAILKITQARSAFIDMDEAPANVAAPEATGRALDLEETFDATPAPIAPGPRPVAPLELD